jgi:hypothetical protein
MEFGWKRNRVANEEIEAGGELGFRVEDLATNQKKKTH